MQCKTHSIRSGYDGKQCLVHARCCAAPDLLLATAQYLNVEGSDLFSGLLSSTSRDGGETWSEFASEEGLAAIREGDRITVGCDATPMYHRKTGKILLLGHTAQYREGDMSPTGEARKTFCSIYNPDTGHFGQMRFLEMPEGYDRCGNGSGQSVELENGDLLIPVYYYKGKDPFMASMVLRCRFDGENLTLLEMGNSLSMSIGRGLYEPSLVCHNGVYYMTMRNDECGCVAKSTDGLHYGNMHLWQWSDGSLLDNYNTQQHWMTVGDELYLVYTRRGADNDHVFRHRAPLFAAKVENMKLRRDTETVLVGQRGARLGNFGVTAWENGKALVMAAEWMQPKGCEKYGSDNSIFLAEVEL